MMLWGGVAGISIGNSVWIDGKIKYSKCLQTRGVFKNSIQKHTLQSIMNCFKKYKLNLVESLFGSLTSPSLKNLWVHLVHARSPKDISELEVCVVCKNPRTIIKRLLSS